MTEPLPDNQNEANVPSILPILQENIEDALVVEIQREALRNRRRRQRRFELRFPNVADLPGLLRSTAGSIFRAVLGERGYQGENQFELDHVPRIEDVIEAPASAEVVEGTWSEYLRRGEQEDEPIRSRIVEPTILNTVCTYPWINSAILNNPSTQSLLGEDDAAFLEKQVITSELDAFITSLQQERRDKYFDKYDQEPEERQARTQIKVGITLFLLSLIVIGNIWAGIFFLCNHFI